MSAVVCNVEHQNLTWSRACISKTQSLLKRSNANQRLTKKNSREQWCSNKKDFLLVTSLIHSKSLCKCWYENNIKLSMQATVGLLSSLNKANSVRSSRAPDLSTSQFFIAILLLKNAHVTETDHDEIDVGLTRKTTHTFCTKHQHFLPQLLVF